MRGMALGLIKVTIGLRVALEIGLALGLGVVFRTSLLACS